MATAATGVFHDRFPYVRIGTGAKPLLVLPGLSLTNEAPSGLVVPMYARGFRRLAQDHTLYVVHRPRGLATGASTQDIAAEYLPVLSRELGPARLMGLSTGGLIAQHLALDNPALVERLALVVTGTRLAARGRAMCAHWLELADAHRWRELHGELGAIAVDGAVAQQLARTLLSLAGRRPSDQEAADFRTTATAVLGHDTRRQLGALEMPALVLGGALDPFFPDELLRETAAAIPDAQLRVFPRNGHGVPKHRAAQMQDAVAGFFAADVTP